MIWDQEKSQKNQDNAFKNSKSSLKNITFGTRVRCVQPPITHSLNISDNFCTLPKNNNMDGLRMRDGRLVNDRPVGISGIAQASQMRKQNKQRSLTQDIALGIELADERKESRKIIAKFIR
tara:strand:- start:4534 stop:4896 length:363 start_codon:yes stop_codon:yes gene_type:complete